MDDIDFQLLEDYLDDLLGLTQKKELEIRLENEPALKDKLQHIKLAKLIVQGEEELEIREMMKEVENETSENATSSYSSFNNKWVLAAIIAGLLIILASVFARLNKVDKQMIAQDLIVKEKSQVVRSNDPIEIDSLIEFGYIQPMKQVNALIADENYTSALEKLGSIEADFPIAKQNMAYTKGLILYLKNGRKDPEFHRILNEILDNPSHNCYNLAVKLDNQVNSIWGRLKN